MSTLHWCREFICVIWKQTFMGGGTYCILLYSTVYCTRGWVGETNLPKQHACPGNQGYSLEWMFELHELVGNRGFPAFPWYSAV